MEKKEYLELYRQMVVIRRMEERAAELYQQGKIGGFLHLYIGQEAISTGLVSARKPQDRVITAYRDHGVAYNCGLTSNEIMAELLGKETGCSKGRGGSMHMADVNKNFWGGHAIVGAHLPIAAGLALGDLYKETDGITICMFGDGASNIGFFHEALNLSKVWNLPVVWVVENNKYGMGTAIPRASAVTDLQQKAIGYGMKNYCVDGMSVLSVREASLAVFEEVRNGSGPQFMEMETYRFVGHSMGDPERYRQRDEVAHWQKNGPIYLYENHLLEENIANKEELNELVKQAEAEVEEAVAFAESSPEPAPETLTDHIYVEP